MKSNLDERDKENCFSDINKAAESPKFRSN